MPFDKPKFGGLSSLLPFFPCSFASFLSFVPDINSPQIPLAFLSRYIQDPNTSHHLHLSPPGPSYQHLSPGLWQQLPNASPCFPLCPLYLEDQNDPNETQIRSHHSSVQNPQGLLPLLKEKLKSLEWSTSPFTICSLLLFDLICRPLSFSLTLWPHWPLCFPSAHQPSSYCTSRFLRLQPSFASGQCGRQLPNCCLLGEASLTTLFKMSVPTPKPALSCLVFLHNTWHLQGHYVTYLIFSFVLLHWNVFPRMQRLVSVLLPALSSVARTTPKKHLLNV